MAVRSKACVCVRSLAGIAGSKPAGDKNVSCQCCVLSDRGLCVRRITRLEKCGVYEGDREGPIAPGVGGRYFARLLGMAAKLDLAHYGENRARVLEEDIWYSSCGT